MALIANGLGGATVSAADAVTVTRLDGSVVTGDLRTWTDSEITVAAAAGDQRIATDQLMSVRWSPPAGDPVKQPTPPAGVVELIDGTQLPINTLTIAGSNASMKLQPTAGSPDLTVVVPANKLAMVRFQHLADTLTSQWEEIRQQKLSSDALVIIKKDGKSLDYVEGVVGEVTPDKIEFKIDDETNRVDRAKVAGVIYYRTNTGKLADQKAALTGAAGLRAAVARLAVDGATVNITTPAGVSFAWPLADLESADFSSGKLAYLSDLEPSSQNWAPMVGLPSGATIASQYGQPRRDHAAFGGPLLLLDRNPDDASAPLTANRTFAKGLALRSRTELVYRLPEGFRRFTALAGIDPATNSAGNVRLSILADDRPLLETEIAGGQPPQPIDVQIAGAKKLKILVDFGQNLDTGDWLNLCDPKIVK